MIGKVLSFYTKHFTVWVVVFVVLASCAFYVVGCNTTQHNTVTQISTIDAILAGSYDGQMTCRELTSYGNFGIGTFDKLDGEMVLLDGEIYQIKADGKVYSPAMNLTTPFAGVVNFRRDITITLNKETDFASLGTIVNKAVANMNTFCAVKVKGRFLKMKTRSVPAQQKPYPPLTEVTRNQSVFHLTDIAGTIVGFRSPVYVKGITVPGYHLHFISEDRKSGGHVLEFVLEEGLVEIDICNRFLMILPEGQSSFSTLDLTLDRSADLREAEKGH